MKIDIILPYKEIYSPLSASAVSLTVKNSMEYSKYKSSIKVYGQFTSNPFSKENFVGIKTQKIIHFGNNRSILMSYLNTQTSLFLLMKNDNVYTSSIRIPYLIITFLYLIN